MSRYNDPDKLKTEQYNNTDKLAARIRLHEGYSIAQSNLQHRIFDLMLEHIPAQAAILEIGAGRGDLWKKNADRIPEGWQVTLTDFSEGMQADCKAYLGDALSARFQWEIVNVQAIPYGADQFDAVLANYMLYHSPDIAQAVSEIRRVLRPEGVLFAATNGENHMDMRFLLPDSDELQAMTDMRAHIPFKLQNGTDYLNPAFASVQMIPFPDALHVNEAQPIIDYIRSMIRHAEDGNLFRKHEGALRAELEKRIAAEGKVIIPKETGLFLAR